MRSIGWIDSDCIQRSWIEQINWTKQPCGEFMGSNHGEQPWGHRKWWTIQTDQSDEKDFHIPNAISQGSYLGEMNLRFPRQQIESSQHTHSLNQMGSIKYHTTVCLFGLIVSDPGHDWNPIESIVSDLNPGPNRNMAKYAPPIGTFLIRWENLHDWLDGTRMYQSLRQIDIEASRNFSLTIESSESFIKWV